MHWRAPVSGIASACRLRQFQTRFLELALCALKLIAFLSFFISSQTFDGLLLKAAP